MYTPVPDNDASAKMVFLHPFKLHVSYERPLLKKNLTTFVAKLSHLSGEIITFRNEIPTGK